MSLDGYIATEDDSLDWLSGVTDPIEDYGFESFLAEVDLVAMGRGTYDFIHEAPDLPYGDRPIHVFTTGTDTLRNGFEPIALSPHEAIRHWQELGIKHASVDGGVVVSSFLRAGLIDDLTLTVAPVLLGSGKPLFHALGAMSVLDLADVRPYASGVVQLRYELSRRADQEQFMDS